MTTLKSQSKTIMVISIKQEGAFKQYKLMHIALWNSDFSNTNTKSLPHYGKFRTWKKPRYGKFKKVGSSYNLLN